MKEVYDALNHSKPAEFDVVFVSSRNNNEMMFAFSFF